VVHGRAQEKGLMMRNQKDKIDPIGAVGVAVVLCIIVLYCFGGQRSDKGGDQCGIIKGLMQDSAKLISGCKISLATPDYDQRLAEYAAKFRSMNVTTARRLDPSFKDGDEWPLLIMQVVEWQMACMGVMLAINSVDDNRFTASDKARSWDNAVGKIKKAEESLHKSCPDLDITEFKRK
jgi:hypothetical protein